MNKTKHEINTNEYIKKTHRLLLLVCSYFHWFILWKFKCKCKWRAAQAWSVTRQFVLCCSKSQEELDYSKSGQPGDYHEYNFQIKTSFHNNLAFNDALPVLPCLYSVFLDSCFHIATYCCNLVNIFMYIWCTYTSSLRRLPETST